VQDTVEGFLSIADAPLSKVKGQEINIASGTEYSVGQIAQALVDQLNPSAKIVVDDARLRPEASEVYRLIGDNRKVHELADWSPRFTLTQGLAATVDWFRRPENLSRYKAGIYNL
jgi:nucleoside-diphosphate-sugar epimerase